MASGKKHNMSVCKLSNSGITVTVKALTGWDTVKELALFTIGKVPKEDEPSEDWERRITVACHSPIRARMFLVKMHNIPYYVSVHLVRHKIGVEHFVRTNRSDRTGRNTDSDSRSTPTNHAMLINAEALITMSRKRLCSMADPTTRMIWSTVVTALSNVDKVVADRCVRNCVHCGFCPEFTSCGFDKSVAFEASRKAYIVGQ